MRQFLKYIVVILVPLLSSCNTSENPVTPSIGKDYYPVKKGIFQIYDVTEIKYQLRIPDTLIYQLKTQVVDSFPSIDGGYSYVIYRDKRNTPAEEWSYLDTWSVRVDNREVVVNEENISYLKIKLPVSINLAWNGNLYNNGGEDDYVISGVGEPCTMGGNNFSNCITITQSDNEDYIVFLDERSEIYARDIGLVYKEITQLNYCSSDPACLGKQIVETGIIFKQVIAMYGIE